MNSIPILLGLFISLESLNAMRLFNGVEHNLAYRLLIASQHVFTGLAGFIIAWYAYLGQLNWIHILLTLSVSIFVLSQALYRWVNSIREHHPELYAYIGLRFDVTHLTKSDLSL